MKVSVIIPLYNKAAHIRSTIESVLAQTYQDFELIVVDDGSTDGSADLVHRCPDSRVRLILQKNAGPSSARNRGAAEAKSELLSFLDADDEWNPDFLETVLALRRKIPEAGVWGTAYTIQRADGKMVPVTLEAEVSRQQAGLIINYFRAAILQQPIHASSMLVRKEAFCQIGGYERLSQPREDTDLLFRLALRYPVAYLPVCKTIYHMNAENRTDTWLWSGNYPFFEHARIFLCEIGDAATLPEDARQYLAFYHTGGLYRNWLAGNQAAMREILWDCGNIRGYRVKCILWRPLVWIPNIVVRLAWKLQARIRGREGKLPPVRNIPRDIELKRRAAVGHASA